MKKAPSPHPVPPALRLLRCLSRYEEDFLLAGDLIEEYRERAATGKAFRVQVWLLLQILRCVPPYVRYCLQGRIAMLMSNLRFAFRQVRRNRGFALLNIVGLALALACFLLIALNVRFELGFDRYHEGADRIFRVATRHAFVYNGRNRSAITPAPMAPALLADFPDVEAAVRMVDADDLVLSVGEQRYLVEKWFFAGPELLDVFSIHLLEGEPESVLSDPASVLLSKSAAERYFGTGDAAGKIIRFENRRDLRVTGIYEDFPENSHFIPEIISPFDLYALDRNLDVTEWSGFGYYTYVKLREGADPGGLESGLQAYLERMLRPGQSREGFGFFLQPLTAVHLHSDLIGEIAPNGNARAVAISAFIAFLILVIACINSVNLVTARAAARGREVGIRKVTGARRGQVTAQFFLEALVSGLLSLALSFLFIQAALPAFNRIAGRTLRFDPVGDPVLLLWMGGLVLLVALLSGAYPAFLLGSFRPAAVLRGGTFKRGRGGASRNILVIAQFTVSILLFIAALAVGKQLRFIRTTDPGFRKDRIVVLTLRDPVLRQKIPALKNALLRFSGVDSVAASSSLPHRISWLFQAWRQDGSREDHFPIYRCDVDEDFLKLFGIELVAGRNFSPEIPSDADGAFILNQAAVKALGYEDGPVERLFRFPVHGGEEKTGRIIGVVKDFHMLSFHQTIQPLALALDPESSPRYLSVRTAGPNLSNTLEIIRRTQEEVSDAYPFEYRFFDDVFAGLYSSEENLGRIFNVFSLLAVLIACLGLFGLASFAAERRTKEIGIRRVLGASVSGLAARLSAGLARRVLAANLFAWPLGYFLMSRWLRSFAYRIPLGPDIFLAAGVLSFFFALLTILAQTLKAASADPVRTLKYE